MWSSSSLLLGLPRRCNYYFVGTIIAGSTCLLCQDLRTHELALLFAVPAYKFPATSLQYLLSEKSTMDT